MVLQEDVLPGWPGRQVSSEVPIPVVLGMGVSNDKEEYCQFSGALLWFTEEGISPDSHILKDLLINREAKNGSPNFHLGSVSGQEHEPLGIAVMRVPL